MSKLYIPTSSINISRILATESISPASFYQQRGFGIRQWDKVRYNILSNIILLYQTTFDVQVNEDHLQSDSYPIFVEIDTDISFRPLYNGIFYTDQTIYLRWDKTRFIVASEELKTQTQLSIKSFSEVKFGPKYQEKIIVKSDTAPSKDEYPIASPQKLYCLNQQALERDFQIDKIKGFFIGYHVGALFSSSLSAIELYHGLQELVNVMASARTDANSTGSRAEQGRINFERVYGEYISRKQVVMRRDFPVDALDTRDKLLGEIFTITGVKGAKIDWTRSTGTRKNTWSSNAEQHTSSESGLFMKDWQETEEAALDDFARRFQLQVMPEELRVASSGLVGVNQSYLRANPKKDKLLVAWVNEVLAKKDYSRSLSEVRNELAYELTTKAKAVLGEEYWNGSFEQKILNGLYAHIKQKLKPYEFDWKDPLLSAISALLICGDNWSNMLKFMRKKKIADYRLAFAFYGEFHGYACLTRDFTDSLIDTNSEYFLRVYDTLSALSEIYAAIEEAKETAPAQSDYHANSSETQGHRSVSEKDLRGISCCATAKVGATTSNDPDSPASGDAERAKTANLPRSISTASDPESASVSSPKPNASIKVAIEEAKAPAPAQSNNHTNSVEAQEDCRVSETDFGGRSKSATVKTNATASNGTGSPISSDADKAKAENALSPSPSKHGPQAQVHSGSIEYKVDSNAKNFKKPNGNITQSESKGRVYKRRPRQAKRRTERCKLFGKESEENS